MFALLVSLHALLCFLPLSVALSFTVSTLSECDDFTLEWTGKRSLMVLCDGRLANFVGSVGGTGPYSVCRGLEIDMVSALNAEHTTSF